jgi:hypothetical protein
VLERLVRGKTNVGGLLLVELIELRLNVRERRVARDLPTRTKGRQHGDVKREGVVAAGDRSPVVVGILTRHGGRYHTFS